MQVSEDTVDAEGATTTTLPVVTSTTTEIEDRSDPAAKEDPDPTKTALPNRTIDVSTLALMLRMFVDNSTSGSQISLPPMDEQTRMKAHGLAPLFGLKSVTEGEGDARCVKVVRDAHPVTSGTSICSFFTGHKQTLTAMKRLKYNNNRGSQFPTRRGGFAHIHSSRHGSESQSRNGLEDPCFGSGGHP
jgi:hypothetical protein